MSHTFFVGETIGNDTANSVNVWTIGGRYEETMRSTSNQLNTPPGQGGFVLDASGNPLYGTYVNGAFGSQHPQGGQFAFGDGHVQMVSDEIDLPTYWALSTIAGSEPINDSLLMGP